MRRHAVKDLSTDAQAVAAGLFGAMLPKRDGGQTDSCLHFGMKKSRPTGRVFAALTELEAAGYVERELRDGGIVYRPLRDCRPIKMPADADFPITEPVEITP